MKIYAGIDDATKCPCIGSVYLAGVCANDSIIKKWKSLGVKDSKLITQKKRKRLAKVIRETALSYTVTHMPPEMIDDKSHNLNAWEMITVMKIAEKLQKKSNPGEILIDNWEVNINVFYRRLMNLIHSGALPKRFLKYNFVPEHRADEKYVVVGAASILAKTSSENQYRNFKRLYGNFGSGSPADPLTRKFVWDHRKNPPPIIRKSWQTYKTLSVLSKFPKETLDKLKKYNN
jgi:ribonuclease HII